MCVYVVNLCQLTPNLEKPQEMSQSIEFDGQENSAVSCVYTRQIQYSYIFTHLHKPKYCSIESNHKHANTLKYTFTWKFAFNLFFPRHV